MRKEVEGSRLGGDAQRPLRTAGAERRQWRKKRGGSPVSKGVEGSRFSGDAQRPLGTAGAERRQWRKKRGGSPVSKGVEGSRLGGDAQRPLRTAEGGGQPPAQSPWQGAENLRRYEAVFLCRAATRYRSTPASSRMLMSWEVDRPHRKPR